MDFTFSDEQQMLRDSVSAFLLRNYDFDQRNAIVRSDAGWSGEVWQQFAELGLTALPYSEDKGGLGGSMADLVAIAEPFGAHLLAEPYLASVVMGGGALAMAPEGSVGAQWLGKVIAGEALAALAYEEGAGTPAPSLVATTAARTGDGVTLTGEKRMVLAGGDADVLVVVAKGEGDGSMLLAVDPASEGVTVTPFGTIDGRRAANVRFDNASVAAGSVIAADASDQLETVLERTMLALCAESVGAMGALLKATAEYAATRKQFGVPIATFQAVAHRLADMKIAYSKARATLLYTTALMDAGRATAKDIAILKGQTGKLGREIGEAAIQTHGGVGMTDELAVSHWHKRILANDAMLGNCAYHLRKVGTLA